MNKHIDTEPRFHPLPPEGLEVAMALREAVRIQKRSPLEADEIRAKAIPHLAELPIEQVVLISVMVQGKPKKSEI